MTNRTKSNSYYLKGDKLQTYGGAINMSKVWVRENGLELLLGGGLQIEGASEDYAHTDDYEDYLKGTDQWTIVTAEFVFLAFKEIAPSFGLSFGTSLGVGLGMVNENYSRTSVDLWGEPIIDDYNYNTGFMMLPELKIIIGPYFDINKHWRINAWFNAGFSPTLFLAGYYGEGEAYGLTGFRVGGQYTFGK
jgi:hypothetical protein